MPASRRDGLDALRVSYNDPGLLSLVVGVL